MKKSVYAVMLPFLAACACLTAAEKNSASDQLKDKAREIIARDQKGESLENIADREIKQQQQPETAKTAPVKITTVPAGPSRLEHWKKQRSQQKASTEKSS